MADFVREKKETQDLVSILQPFKLVTSTYTYGHLLHQWDEYISLISSIALLLELPHQLLDVDNHLNKENNINIKSM